MKILLTGHNGLVGSAILNEIDCVTYPNRINDQKSFEEFLMDNKVDTVIHAAGKVGGLQTNFENKIDFYLENSKLNNIVFESCYKNKIQNLINFSSTCVFPDEIEYPLTEDKVFQGPPHFSNDAYAYSKRMMQMLCRLAREEGLNYITLIPTNIFGENDNFNLYHGHVLPALIHKCYLAKQNNTEFAIWGSGLSLREFVYSADVAKIVKDLLCKKINYDSLIVSSSHEITIANCAKLIAKFMKYDAEIIFDTSKPEGQFRKPTNNLRLKSVLPNFEFTNFEFALENSVNWFIENYSTLRK
jgi:GDP-L-fucose synthase